MDDTNLGSEDPSVERLKKAPSTETCPGMSGQHKYSSTRPKILKCPMCYCGAYDVEIAAESSVMYQLLGTLLQAVLGAC